MWFARPEDRRGLEDDDPKDEIMFDLKADDVVALALSIPKHNIFWSRYLLNWAQAEACTGEIDEIIRADVQLRQLVPPRSTVLLLVLGLCRLLALRIGEV